MDLVQILANMDWCNPAKDNGIVVIQNIVSTIILAIQIAVPVLLVIFGMIDLGKAVVASKEDEIKKGQQTFIKRLIAAAIVFLVIFVVKLLVNIVASSTENTGDEIDSNSIWKCANRFISGSSASSTNNGNQ